MTEIRWSRTLWCVELSLKRQCCSGHIFISRVYRRRINKLFFLKWLHFFSDRKLSPIALSTGHTKVLFYKNWRKKQKIRKIHKKNGQQPPCIAPPKKQVLINFGEFDVCPTSITVDRWCYRPKEGQVCLWNILYVQLFLGWPRSLSVNQNSALIRI